MKTLYTLALVLTLTLSTKAQWVTIPDAAFATKLQQLYPSCMNGNQMDTTCSAIVNATVLDVSWLGISNLYGVQFFDNLNQLICSNNQLSSLPSLPSSLTSLNCSNNQLSSLPSLPSSLTTLYCNNNQLTNLPSLPSSLTFLWCYSNQLSSLPSLPSTLTNLRCYNNQLSNLPSLPSTLTSLSCGNNQLTSLPQLPSILKSLKCQYNQITELPTLPDSLELLWCYDNQITSLNNIPSKLNKLEADNNQLQTISNLPDSLSVLRIDHNSQLKCLPPIYKITATSSAYVDIYMTGITCLPNVIQHPYIVNLPELDNKPICEIINPKNCTVGWNVIGNIQFDIDSNCNTINNNINLKNIKVKIYDNSYNLIQQVYSNAIGKFSFNVLTGSYKIEIDTNNLSYLIKCPIDNSINITLNSTNPTSQNNTLQLVCKPGFDLGATSINRINGMIFPGQQSTIRVKAGDLAGILNNISCNTTSLQGQIKVKVNGPASYAGAATGALIPTISNDTLKYDIEDFTTVNPNISFVFNLLTDTTAQGGQQVCIEVWVTPTAGDNNTSNNHFTQCFTVINSYDPNIKEVFPQKIYQSGEWLTYTIHFQNTGTAPALNIRVKDTLSSLLDWESFRLLDYSHEVFTQILANGIVHFNFLNIMLSDSMSNPEGSKGYVQFKIKTKNDFVPPMTLTNSASIYFDFNTPIKTNDAVVSYATGISKVNTSSNFTIYPNPAQEAVHINTSCTNCTLSVVDIQGRVITTQQLTNSNTTLSTATFAPGIYFIELQNERVVERKKLVLSSK